MIINKNYMREIKFRAYNRDWNMTLPVDEIKFENGEAVSVSVTIKASDYDHEGEWEDYIIGDEITIEQFTGLKDRNGKDIYFDDLVSDEDGYTGKIVEGEYGIIILWLVEDGTWVEAESPEEYFKPTRLEVIGNIHENQELINLP